jgi:hypothetical protein
MVGFLKKFANRFDTPNATIQLKFDNYSVTLGEKLNGSLTVNSQEEFDVTEVRCEIQCVEKAQVVKNFYDPASKRTVARSVEETAVLFSSKPVLNGPFHLANGNVRDFPLSISFPAGGRPSYQGVDRRVTWTIKGVVAVDDRPDVTSRVETLQVIAPTTQVIRQEVVREIVRIPCKYCGTLFDQLETTCPNCGGKRTA